MIHKNLLQLTQGLFIKQKSHFIFLLCFYLLLAPDVFTQDDNTARTPAVSDQVRESYTEQDYRIFLENEKDKEIMSGGIIYNPAAADALANNNTGATPIAYFTQSETSILAFNNNIVIGFNDSGSHSGGANKFTGWAYSTDGGNTFIDGGTLPTNAIGDAGDPVLARNNATGRIYFSTLGFNSPSFIQVFRSDDNGLTWMPPVNGTPGGINEDKQWVTVDNFSGTGSGNVYIISRRFGPGPGIYFFRSTDNGDTFGPAPGILIFPGGQGSFVAVGPDHAVYAFFYDGTSSLQVRKSSDLGLTFGAPVTVAAGLIGGTNGDLGLTGIRQGFAAPAPFRSNEFPHAAVNPVSGHLYVTYANKPPAADKADIYMVMSSDGGASWSAPVRVNDDTTTTDQWMPTIAVTPDGSSLGIFYYSRQEDPGNNLFKYYARTASISGSAVNFYSSFPVSDAPSLPEFGRDNVVNSVYMGDYNQTAATAGGFHVAWSDNRDDLAGGAPRKDPNVYYKFIPVGPGQPSEIIADLLQKVADLYTAGALNKGQANSLTKKLLQAEKSIPDKIAEAIESLTGFIDQVNSFVIKGVLTIAQGESLTIPATALITSLENGVYKQIADKNIDVPAEFSLAQNYPNPFNPSTIIKFSVAEAKSVTLKVYDILGSEVQTLINEELNPGNYEINYNAAHLASGVYIYTLNSGTFNQSRKFILMK